MRTIMCLLVATGALLAACAQPSGSTGSPTSSPSGDPAPRDDLVIEVDRGDGSPAERYTLTCGDQPAGSHPDPAAACAHLSAMEEPFAPLADDLMCTEQYGGPQTARVTGLWEGEPVDLELSRIDGCRISQWDGLGPLLPGPVGVAPPTAD